MTKRWGLAAPAVLAVLALLAGCAGDGGEPAVGARSEAPVVVGDIPSDVLQGRWWTWAYAEPDDSNPVVDPTGEDCDVGQPRDLWFLAGTFGGTVTRSCDVPADRPIVAPVVNLVAPTRRDCASFLDAADGSVRLDGDQLPLERLTPVQIDYRDVEAQRGWACGLWVRLDPLPSGRHRLEIDGRSGGFSVGVDYRLTVG